MKRRYFLWFLRTDSLRWFLYDRYVSDRAAEDAIKSICTGEAKTHAFYDPINWEECIWKIVHPSGGSSIHKYSNGG